MKQHFWLLCLRAPSDYHPVREKERLLERRNYVLKEMFQNGYLPKRIYEYELTQPIKSVQGRDYAGFRLNCRVVTTSQMK